MAWQFLRHLCGSSRIISTDFFVFYLRITQLIRHLASGDISWILHRFRLLLRLRGLVPRPEVLVSRVEPALGLRYSHFGDRKSLKVLFFSHNLNYEGASISLKELILGISRLGHIDSEVVAFEDGPLRVEYESNGIFVQVLPNNLDKISTISRLNNEVDRLASIIVGSGARLVFVNTLLNFPAILAAENAGINSVWNPRESESWASYFRFLPDPVAQKAIASIGLPKKVVFVAHSTKRVWDSFDVNGNFEVIQNGINLARFPLKNDLAERRRCRSELGIDDDKVVLICVGTLCDRKGQIDIVEALSKLPIAIISRVQIIFVGEASSSYGRKVKNRCHSLPNVRFIDATQSISTFYAASDIYVLSSKIESFPRVILEAMAFGLPIIATPVFGVLEQVIEEGNAFLYPSGNSCLLASFIEKLVVDDLLRERMGKKSLEYFSQLKTFEEMIVAYEQICMSAIN